MPGGEESRQAPSGKGRDPVRTKAGIVFIIAGIVLYVLPPMFATMRSKNPAGLLFDKWPYRYELPLTRLIISFLALVLLGIYFVVVRGKRRLNETELTTRIAPALAGVVLGFNLIAIDRTNVARSELGKGNALNSLGFVLLIFGVVWYLAYRKAWPLLVTQYKRLREKTSK